MATPNNPIPQAEALHTALQPANVQMAILVDLMKKLAEETKKTTKVEEEAIKARKSSQQSLLSIAKNVKTGVVAAMATAAGAITGMVGQVKSLLGGFVGAFRPDVMKRFQLIVEDLMASIGENLVPLLIAAGQVFRWIGDTIAGVTKYVQPLIVGLIAAFEPLLKQLGAFYKSITNINVLNTIFKLFGTAAAWLGEALKIVLPIVSALGKVFQTMFGFGQKLITAFLNIAKSVLSVIAVIAGPFGSILNSVAQIFADVGETIGDAIGELAKAFGEVLKVILENTPIVKLFTAGLYGMANAMKYTAEKIREWINQLRKLLNLPALKDADLRGDSRGKSAQPAAFTTTDEIWKKFQAQTFGGGRGDPMLNEAKDQNKWLKGIFDEIKRHADAAKNKPGATPQSDGRRMGYEQDQWRQQQLSKG